MKEVKEETWAVLTRLMQSKGEGAEVLQLGEEQLVISHEPCPAVLGAANKQFHKILLVQKFTQQNKKRLLTTTSSTICNGNNSSNSSSTPAVERNGHKPSLSDDMDVTGSPLKCPFLQDGEEVRVSPFTISLQPNSSKKKGSAKLFFIPVPSAKAGLIASHMNLALNKIPKDVEEFLPLWVVCDGKDAQGTLFIGIHREGDTHSRTLVTSGGPYQEVENLPSLDHLTRHHTALGCTKRVHTVVEADYIVLASENIDKASSISLTCTWKRPLTLLSAPAPDATTIANLHMVCSDPHSPAHQMHQELSVLRGFVSGLETGEVAWFVREGIKTVEEELREVFVSIMEKGVRVKREDEGGCDFDMMIEGKFFNWRQNMDFTDRLWSILMRCESYQELIDSLNLVFRAVAGEEVRPQIHVRNTTQVGCLLRNLMRGKVGLPELTGFTPLHMLIEIGCEKIKRDYINIFQAGELATGEQLAWFVGSSGSTEPAQIVDNLERLHVALQVVVALRTYLSLPLASLMHFAAQVLNQMKEEEPSVSHSFSLKLDTLSVHQQFDSLKMDTWVVSLHSQEGTHSKDLLCHISHAPLIQLSSAESENDEMLEDEEKGEEEAEDQYFCTFFCTVTDKILQH